MVDRYDDRPTLLSKIIRILGITEADIKSLRYRHDCYWFVLTTYSHRKFTVTAEELHR